MQEGQTVYCAAFGKGVITKTNENENFHVVYESEGNSVFMYDKNLDFIPNPKKIFHLHEHEVKIDGTVLTVEDCKDLKPEDSVFTVDHEYKIVEIQNDEEYQAEIEAINETGEVDTFCENIDKKIMEQEFEESIILYKTKPEIVTVN